MTSVTDRDRGTPRDPPLPHHRAYGSVPRRFDRVKRGQERGGGGEREHRKKGCAEPVGRPDVRTCARNRSASRQQPPRGTLAGHAVAVLGNGWGRFASRRQISSALGTSLSDRAKPMVVQSVWGRGSAVRGRRVKTSRGADGLVCR